MQAPGEIVPTIQLNCGLCATILTRQQDEPTEVVVKQPEWPNQPLSNSGDPSISIFYNCSVGFGGSHRVEGLGFSELPSSMFM